MSRPDLEALQEVRLGASLERSFRQSPLIRSIWAHAGLAPSQIKSLADFRAAAPFIDKDSIRAFRDAHGDPTGGLSGVSAPDLKGMGFTSGTTGDPTPMPRGVRLPYDVTFQRELWEIGARPGDYVSRVMFSFRFGISLQRFLNLGLRPIAFEFAPREIPRLIEASLRYRPTTLCNLSNGLIASLEKEFERSKVDPRNVLASYKGAMFGGEPLGVRERELADQWGLELFCVTSLGDVVGAMECRAHDGFHAWEDFALVEAIDPNGDQPVADGEIGELVVSSLGRDIGCLIRYRTDDLIIIDRSTCACGRTHLRFKLLGRKSDQVLVGGRSVMPVDIWSHVQSQPESIAGLFQVIRQQRELDVLQVRVGYDPGVLRDSPEKLAGRIACALEDALHVPCRVTAVEEGELLKLGPPHKIPRVSKS
jgi:phenylacetate-CoA ligase